VKIDNFFAELKRRNVYKIAVAYAVVAWLLIQAASIFFARFRRAAVGHESVSYLRHPVFSGRPGYVLGF
jgi:hypothetical protein